MPIFTTKVKSNEEFEAKVLRGTSVIYEQISRLSSAIQVLSENIAGLRTELVLHSAKEEQERLRAEVKRQSDEEALKPTKADLVY